MNESELEEESSDENSRLGCESSTLFFLCLKILWLKIQIGEKMSTFDPRSIQKFHFFSFPIKWSV
jgi:hypothetical protein